MAIQKMMTDSGSRKATSPSLISSLWNTAKQSASGIYDTGKSLYTAVKPLAQDVYSQVKTYANQQQKQTQLQTATGSKRTQTPTGGTNSNKPSSGTSGGTAIKPTAAASAPTYSQLNAQGPDVMSFDEYKQSLIDAVKGGIMAEYEANATVIKNNLTRALSELEAEQAALDPLYQNQLKNIQQRKYATGVQQTELMNQAGWNATNSGLAVGEHTRIANQASEETAQADQSYNQYMADILRRQTLNKGQTDEQLASLEREKNAKLSGAESGALVQADDRNRSMYESDRNFEMQGYDRNRAAYESDRNFEMQKTQFQESIRQWEKNYSLNEAQFKESQRQFNASLKQRTAAAKATDAKDATKFSDAEIDNMTTLAFTEIMKTANPIKALDIVLRDPELPTKAKQTLMSMMSSHKSLNSTSSSGIQLTTD